MAERIMPSDGGESPLVSPTSLSGLLHSDRDVAVLDVRFNLSNKSRGREAYLDGHIPGAFYFDLEQDLSSPVREHGGRHPLPDVESFVEKLRAAGVQNGGTVVVYDDGGGMAPRAWWLLRYLGHERVYVLDGGFPAWVAAGYTVSQDVPLPSHGDFVPRVQTQSVVSVDDVRQIANGHAKGILVDSRADDRYRGLVEPIDKVAGHIPTALNKPWEKGLGPGGRFQSAEAQRQRFQDVLDSGKPIVVYCGSGVTACANLLALEIAGVTGAKLYPGSWSDWCSFPQNPVERTDEI